MTKEIKKGNKNKKCVQKEGKNSNLVTEPKKFTSMSFFTLYAGDKIVFKAAKLLFL